MRYVAGRVDLSNENLPSVEARRGATTAKQPTGPTHPGAPPAPSWWTNVWTQYSSSLLGQFLSLESQRVERCHFGGGEIEREQVEVLSGVLTSGGRVAARANRHHRATLEHPPQAHLTGT